MLIDADMRDIVRRSTIGYVATVGPGERPNLSPKGSLVVYDDTHLCFADIASPQTVANLQQNPYVEVNFVDVIARRGYRFEGAQRCTPTGRSWSACARS